MDSEPIVPAPQPRRLIARAFAWGVGFGVGFAVALSAIYYYSVRPKGWDADALRVKHARAESLDKLDDKLEQASVGVLFTVDIENTTGTDIILAKTLNVMQATKDSGALHGSMLTLGKDYFIPARHTVSISLENDDLCAAKVEGKLCFDQLLQERRAACGLRRSTEI
jgi:hypothetical protein